ncbi:Enoyl-CoA hydratase [Pseudonocardia sp. Ae168_Ps1]|jgi:enoyl-CoA hydratase|nr:enoyl-CoA hydratase [Pseudonocardia sp. EC080625-04]ALL76443.1 enoyl-CoA hydratase [Pseudonocardia sp. EC080610-09]ALL83470.1 enoyl-CoA hydratase [Pseudonocardia sp. EC080619-01]OLL72703.1 Enoyl-CoA hydratase [Pseudonocardia sp. Ae150A_Ps1]OLL78674.1 Enoyl-CoA hydratase [Pseudonocardia sp. Ae168_Ps1]OLL87197.1 Enoyl-CoA hydratase [Pseudonocardia sp. Ae263_Ps1]OLL92773.1 Enoyl-CoA hydratase [Pseudonocardia sp. Ae356_Ps1]OLM19250.1 Enoyl-CoA hydratase [Pseudonocardia sp. Ae707_Ps1]
MRARVETEKHGHVLLVRMTRPDKRNAVDAAMTAALDEALNRLDDDPDLWCGVLAGDVSAFSAGTDLAGGSGGPTPRGGNYGVVRRDRRRPLIAAVEGAALGGGFEIVLACDLVVASRTARFGLPEVARGLVANCGALFRAPRPLPLNVAKQMLVTGRPLDAERAHALGLVNELVEPGEAEAAALELAGQVCANSPLAVSLSLRALERVVAEPDERGWAATEIASAEVKRSADAEEGVAAFLEKREPRWTGR